MTDAVRAQAAARPGSWIYAVDSFFEPTGDVPNFGIIGAWKADDRGRLTGEFKHNPKYRPSPRSLGMKKPLDAVDSAIQLAAAGYIDEAAMRSIVSDSTVFLIPGSAMAVHTDSTTGQTLVIYTNEYYAPSSVPQLQKIEVRTLIAKLADHTILKLNPGSSASVEIPAADLR
ncbi:type VII secretion system-associated protein [Streptomyces sp. S584]|uniref:type VII secretion system-associated protein n=1 Tax=Streptomyces sp. S584 TaxID=3096010 RepID=UPI002AFEDFAE|nr:type VII secretion system-associated protein [Streptomyces sp. S584]